MPEMKIPGSFKHYVEMFKVLDGKGQLWSPSGQFLGLLSSDPNNANSIINPEGEYGSPFSLKSIHNPHGVYGGSNGINSPFNPNCINPPLILYKGKPVLVVTNNPNVFTNGLKAIDPYIMLGIYEEFSNAKSKEAFFDV
jgi:hypothetical protein